MIRFADDIVVIAESKGDIQQAVDKMNEMLRTLEMKINDVSNVGNKKRRKEKN